jgi:alpha-tubulin suppressor-like RCC1 family protein
MIRGSTYAAWGFAFALGGCSEVSGVEEIPCQPGCKDATTRVYCDAAGKAQTEVCPSSNEECAASACEAGACTFKPAVGAPCGETEGAKCNEGFACLGGNYHFSAILQQTCLAADDGKVWCWGTNQYQQLGDGTISPGSNPVLVRGLRGHAEQVSTGYGHTCALVRGGAIHCWGNNLAGQCGVTPSATAAEPVLVEVPGVRFTTVATGQGHTCGIAEDKTVYCWGHTGHGQCGSDPDVTGLFVGPTRVPDLDSVESIVTVKNHTCAVRSKAPTMMCWGSNTYVEREHVSYKLGPGAGDIAFSPTPIAVDLGVPVIGLGMGYESTYALTEDGRVFAWGLNRAGQLGIEGGPNPASVATPALVMVETASGRVPLTGVESLIRSDGSDQCVKMRERLPSGTWFMCWGGDDWGEVGAGTEEGARTNHPYPIAMRALPPEAEQLVRGEDHGCAAVPLGDRTEIQCYGRPGVLGNGSPRAGDAELPSQWVSTPVIWKPENFAPALADASE